MKKELCLLLTTSLLLSGCAAAAKDMAAPEANRAMDIATWGYVQEEIQETEIVSGRVPEAAVQWFSEDAEMDSPTSAFSGSDLDAKLTSDKNEDSLIYAVFPGSGDEAFSEDETQIFVGKRYTAVITTQDTQKNAWLSDQMAQITADNDSYRDELIAEADEMYTQSQTATDGFTPSFYAYSYYAYASTARMDSRILSVLLVNSWYRGGAHPTSEQTAYNFDLQEQTILSLEDILLPDTREAFLELVLQSLEDRISALNDALNGAGLYSDYQQTVIASITGEPATVNWYFSDNGLVIYYNHYDIAPYAAGIVTVELPYSDLADILCPEYFPEAVEGEPDGCLILAPEGQGTTEIILEFRSLGDDEVWQTAVGAEGTVYNVRMYTVSSWLDEDAPILGNMVFSANRLTEAERLRITSDTTSAGTYLITYSTPGGNRSVALDQEGLREVSVRNAN